LDDVENDLKVMDVRGWRKVAREIDPKGGNGPTWTVEPMENRR